MGTAIELIVSLGAILGAAVLFTNAIEMLGERLNPGQGTTGSVLAAVGEIGAGAIREGEQG